MTKPKESNKLTKNMKEAVAQGPQTWNKPTADDCGLVGRCEPTQREQTQILSETNMRETGKHKEMCQTQQEKRKKRQKNRLRHSDI